MLRVTGRSLPSKSSMKPAPLVFRLGRLSAISASSVSAERSAVLTSGSASTIRVSSGTSRWSRRSMFQMTLRVGSAPTRTRRSLLRSLL